jgi:Kdo2-lipid IVA lauroyltransferase/acyltransferase
LHDLRQRIAYVFQSAGIAIVFGLLRLMPVDWASDMAGFVGRKIGPLLNLSRIGRENLRAAFPEKSAAEIEAILVGSWDNLIRTFAEYSQLDRFWDEAPEDGFKQSRIEFVDRERFLQLRDHQRPGIVFTGHCGNWELLPVAAERYGLPLAIVFRPPNNPLARRLVEKVRRRSMGRMLPSSVIGTAAAAAGALDRGDNLGLLIDQYFGRGIDVPFFGRPARTPPTLGKLARQFDCPVTGVVVERLKGAHFRLRILPPIEIPRTREGDIDDGALMAAVTKALEDWVRAHPEQWLWVHRRWR